VSWNDHAEDTPVITIKELVLALQHVYIMIYINHEQRWMDKKSRRKRTKRPADKGRDETPKKESGSTLKKASLFMNGRSQAVRLPKEFRFEGTHVYARKDGNRVILSPVDDRIEGLIALMGSSPDFPDIPREPAEAIRPEIKEYFGIPD